MTLLIADNVNLLRGDFPGGGYEYMNSWLSGGILSHDQFQK